MPVIDFEERKRPYGPPEVSRPAVITFYGAFHADHIGNMRSPTIGIVVDGGWSELMENRGIGGENGDGQSFFLPWPCATVDVHHPDPFEASEVGT